eukprot:CAMPEP_0119006014 /NCGR_PEP_ID=MMETSP1176-20130426/2068_1 /TAXON_ID=265551 /ORGANISM="Synedropsis recta cf, Strain CCMP1620" /LENGTH=109 /DNA_ID=CAMNT_0006957895 /DNA_START=104 /DNA_END=433 /DNA_ORIENTATION=+
MNFLLTVLLLSLCLSYAQCLELSSSAGGLRSQAEASIDMIAHRRLTETNTEGPWELCMYLQFEICEAYLLAQADDIYVLRVNPQEYDYSRIIVVMNGETQLVERAPMRG